MTKVLVPGDTAPQFQSQAVQRGEVVNLSLEDALSGAEYLLLVFYPADFTFVCPTEIVQFTEKHEEFKEQGCNIVCCSTDSVYTHLAWLKAPKSERGLGAANPSSIVLLSDRSHEISCAYGVLAAGGAAYRGTFLIDKSKTICQVTINDMPVGRSVDDALRMLKQLRGGSHSGHQANSSNAVQPPWRGHGHVAAGHQTSRRQRQPRQQQQQQQFQPTHDQRQSQPSQQAASDSGNQIETQTARNSRHPQQPDDQWPAASRGELVAKAALLETRAAQLRLKDSEHRLALILAEVERLRRESEQQRMDTERLKAEALLRQSEWDRLVAGEAGDSEDGV